jgi:hypothetical protein
VVLEVVVIIVAVGLLTVGLPLAAWRAWLAFFPGISLRADYGIRGGWFGSAVEVRSARTSSGRSWSR